VSFGLDVLVDFAEAAVGIDHEARAIPIHRAFVLALSHARSVEQGGVRVGEMLCQFVNGVRSWENEQLEFHPAALSPATRALKVAVRYETRLIVV
jgi:hypothetical protein